MISLSRIRRLIAPLLVLLLCACTSGPAPGEAATEPLNPTPAVSPSDSVLRHAVLFSFKEDSYPAGVRAVEEAFRALPDQIAEIQDFEWGVNNSPEGLDKGFTHLFFVTFANEADRAAYLPHPAHQAFVAVLQPHLKDVLVLDYWTR